MRNLSKFEIIGRVGKIDAKDKVVTMSIAANYPHKNKDGEWEDEAYWNRVKIFFEQQRNYAASKVAVGDLIRVEGRMRDTSFKDRDGNEVYATDRIVYEIGVLAKKDAASGE